MNYEAIPRYDMAAPPTRTRFYLRPVTKLLSMPDIKKHQAKISYEGLERLPEGLKPPYLILANHNAFLDFKVATAAIYPQRANYIVAIDGFLAREGLLRKVGCICTRKFTNDPVLVRNMQQVVRNGDVLIMYPEARYSLCGTTAVLPSSLGKLCKLLKVPVFSFICHGHHINSPFWNLTDRGVKPTEATLKLLYTPEDLKAKTAAEINTGLVEAFQYDDFAWQKERGIRISYEGRAEGLDKVLYQCKCCGKEYKMASKGTKLFCKECGASWEMNELGELLPEGGGDPVHIPDWYEWERANVCAEVEAGTYSSGELPVRVMGLPNAKKYIDIGTGIMVHDMNGFRVTCTDKDGDSHSMEKPVHSLYSCHIEYEYLGKYGDLVDLNINDDTWYIRPYDADFAVTKMALATEELYFADRRARGIIDPPGLA